MIRLYYIVLSNILQVSLPFSSLTFPMRQISPIELHLIYNGQLPTEVEVHYGQ